MKLLIVSETLYEGGAEIFVLRLARGLKRNGIDVTILNMNAAYENHKLTATFPEVPIVRMKMPLVKVLDKIDEWLMRLKIDFSVKYYFQLKTLARKYAKKYTIIQSNYSRIDLLFSKLRGSYDFKHIVSVHGDYSDQYYRGLKKETTGWLHTPEKIKTITNAADALVVVSEEQKKFFIDLFAVPAEKIRKIYYGFEYYGKPVSPTPGPKPFTIGMVARGTAQKGWQLMIDAFLQLPKGSKLVLIGGGDYMDRLKEQYRQETSIIFAGYQSNTIEWLQDFDVFALPSLYPFESLPNAIIEALYCGKPVIASNTGEIEAMLTDSDTGEKAGYIIDMKDQVKATDEIAEHLKYLSRHPEQLQKFSQTAKRCFEKFRLEKSVNNYLNLYEQLSR